jgi:hypothetical protein
MRKIIIPSLIASMIAFSPALHCQSPDANDVSEYPVQADDSSTETENTQPQDQNSTTPIIPQEDSSNSPSPEGTAPEEEFTDEEEEGTPVGQASNEGANAAKRRQWRNIALAVGAVAVAVTALILVSCNDGHHHHRHHGDDK